MTEATERSDVIRILLVEDNMLDVRATIRAAGKLQIENTIDHVTDGAAAMEYLHAARPKPDLVLLDLNLPGKDGHDVLAEIRADDGLRRIPVVILTTSENDADIVSSYDLGANAFVAKPATLEGWRELATSIEAFWFTLVKFPPR